MTMTRSSPSARACRAHSCRDTTCSRARASCPTWVAQRGAAPGQRLREGAVQTDGAVRKHVDCTHTGARKKRAVSNWTRANRRRPAGRERARPTGVPGPWAAIICSVASSPSAASPSQARLELSVPGAADGCTSASRSSQRFKKACLTNRQEPGGCHAVPKSQAAGKGVFGT
jgi:hypothetical protein